MDNYIEVLNKCDSIESLIMSLGKLLDNRIEDSKYRNISILCNILDLIENKFNIDTHKTYMMNYADLDTKDVLWMEVRSKINEIVYTDLFPVIMTCGGQTISNKAYFHSAGKDILLMNGNDYNITWRCFNRKPTFQDMKDIKWNEEMRKEK